MKKILIIIISIIVLQGCVKNSGDVVNDDNIPEETMIEVSQEEFEYVEFEYDYPEMSEVPSEYLPKGFEYAKDEEDMIDEIIKMDSNTEKLKIVTSKLINDDLSPIFRLDLLLQSRKIYTEINNYYHIILVTDQLFHDYDYVFD